jgi:hypothetical protein
MKDFRVPTLITKATSLRAATAKSVSQCLREQGRFHRDGAGSELPERNNLYRGTAVS